jgi:membrane protein DedA with SNARE-associated domain
MAMEADPQDLAPDDEPPVRDDELATDDDVDDVPAEPWTWAQRLLLAAFVALLVVANIGSILAPHLQKSSPAGLLAMSSRNRHLLFAIGNHISLAAYAIVASARIMLAALVCYGLGRAFGPRALRWFSRFLGVPKTSIDQLEARFEAASWVLVPFLCGSNIVCVLAGLRPLSVKRFVTLIAIGIAARLTLFWVLADHLRKPLDWFVRQTSRFQLPLIGILLVWVVATNLRHLRHGAR